VLEILNVRDLFFSKVLRFASARHFECKKHAHMKLGKEVRMHRVSKTIDLFSRAIVFFFLMKEHVQMFFSPKRVD
jgi:hypothetical protein